jgi:UBA-like domain
MSSSNNVLRFNGLDYQPASAGPANGLHASHLDPLSEPPVRRQQSLFNLAYPLLQLCQIETTAQQSQQDAFSGAMPVPPGRFNAKVDYTFAVEDAAVKYALEQQEANERQQAQFEQARELQAIVDAAEAEAESKRREAERRKQEEEARLRAELAAAEERRRVEAAQAEERRLQAEQLAQYEAKANKTRDALRQFQSVTGTGEDQSDSGRAIFLLEMVDYDVGRATAAYFDANGNIETAIRKVLPT